LTDMNEIAMQLVTLGQTEAAIKIQTQLEEVNKKWSELQTTTNERQMAFERAHEVQRYNHDAEETRDWILEKYEALTIEDLGKDLRSVQALQRKHEGLHILFHFFLAGPLMEKARALEFNINYEKRSHYVYYMIWNSQCLLINDFWTIFFGHLFYG
jgi:hypothetical protein